MSVQNFLDTVSAQIGTVGDIAQKSIGIYNNAMGTVYGPQLPGPVNQPVADQPVPDKVTTGMSTNTILLIGAAIGLYLILGRG